MKIAMPRDSLLKMSNVVSLRRAVPQLHLPADVSQFSPLHWRFYCR